MITKVNAHPKLDAPALGHFCVAICHASLHLSSAADRVDHAGEFHQLAVSGYADEPTAALCDFRVDQVASKRLEPHQGAFVVHAHEPPETGDIAYENGGQPTFNAFRGQSGAPQTARAE
jgi:hypothetical protein